METSLCLHMHMCTYLGREQRAGLAPSKGDIASTVVNGTSPSGPPLEAPQATSRMHADARCELRSGQCARPITPSESTRWRNAGSRGMGSRLTCSVQSAVLQLTDKASRGHCDLRTAPGCISQIIL